MNLTDKLKQKKWEIVFFLSILFVGVFLRAHNFSSWLHFELDQVYDITVVSKAVESGVQNLPLLGPTAGGGRSLRLGPAYYYLIYASAKIFGDNPAGYAMVVLIFSLLSLPVFYFFCRKYFSKFTSFSLFAIYATSIYLVLYSRFAWSPNVLPFLMLAFSYALLQSVSSKEKRPGHWFMLAAFLFAIITQIHYNALFITSPVVLFFLIIKKPRFPWKTWLGAVAIIFVIYSPMIFSDLKTGGTNILFFKDKLENKAADESSSRDTNVGNKFLNNLAYNAYENFFILSGNDQINGYLDRKLYFLDFSHPDRKSFNFDLNFWLRMLALVIFLAEIVIIVRNFKKEKEMEKKNFLVLISLWLVFSFLYFFALIYTNYIMHPRFFLIISPLPIILLGFILEKFYLKKKLLYYAIAIFVASIFIFNNTKRAASVFYQLSTSASINRDAEVEEVFPNTNRITLEQEQMIMRIIDAKYRENNFPVYLKINRKYLPAFDYLVREQGIPTYQDFNDADVYARGNYFFVEKGQPAIESIRTKFKNYNLERALPLGTLSFYEFSPKTDKITTQAQLDNGKDFRYAWHLNYVLSWRDLLH